MKKIGKKKTAEWEKMETEKKKREEKKQKKTLLQNPDYIPNSLRTTIYVMAGVSLRSFDVVLM